MNNHEEGLNACDNLMRVVDLLYQYADMATMFDSPERSKQIAKIADSVRKSLAQKMKPFRDEIDSFQ